MADTMNIIIWHVLAIYGGFPLIGPSLGDKRSGLIRGMASHSRYTYTWCSQKRGGLSLSLYFILYRDTLLYSRISAPYNITSYCQFLKSCSGAVFLACLLSVHLFHTNLEFHEMK